MKVEWLKILVRSVVMFSHVSTPPELTHKKEKSLNLSFTEKRARNHAYLTKPGDWKFLIKASYRDFATPITQL